MSMVNTAHLSSRLASWCSASQVKACPKRGHPLALCLQNHHSRTACALDLHTFSAQPTGYRGCNRFSPYATAKRSGSDQIHLSCVRHTFRCIFLSDSICPISSAACFIFDGSCRMDWPFTAGATLYRNFLCYAFVLAGYTAAMVGMTNIANPYGFFDYTVGRCSEVMVGILCSALISDLVFPQSLRPPILATIQQA